MKHEIHFPVGPKSIKHDQQNMLFLRKQRISVGNIIRGVRVRVRVPESSGRNKRFSERIIGSYRYSRRKKRSFVTMHYVSQLFESRISSQESAVFVRIDSSSTANETG